MERAAAISAKRLAARVGQEVRVLVDQVLADVALARSAAEAPEIDGVVRIVRESGVPLGAGQWADVKLVSADTYDLTGRLSGHCSEAAGSH
jgi:ribosomal protein S12 methylthiotransferase